MEYAKHLRVAIYARVSTAKQAERDLSVPEQIDSIKAFCNERGWPVVAIFRDEGISGKSQVLRTEFSRMLKQGLRKDRPFDLILTRDHSRFGRGDADNLSRNNLRQYGCRVDNIDEPFGDMTPEGITASGKNSERLQSAADISLREKVAPLVRRSQIKATELGKFPGANGTMFGYTSVYLGGGPKPKRHVELHPENAPIVAELFKRYAEGESLHSLTKWLNEMAVPTPRNGTQWYNGNLRRILTNETALGRIVYGRTITEFDPETEKPKHVKSRKEPVRYEGAFPPLVSKELFDAVQARLQKNERRRPRGGHPGNLIRGVGVCAQCGWGLAFQERRGKWFYLCESKKQKGAKAHERCSGTLPADHVHAVVLYFLKRVVAVQGYQPLIQSAIRVYNNSITEYRGDPELAMILTNIKRLERERDNLVTAIARGMDLSAIRDKVYDIESKISAATKRRDEIHKSIKSRPQLDEQQVLSVAKSLRSAIKANDLPKIKELLGGLVERIEVDFTKRKMRDVTFNARIPFSNPILNDLDLSKAVPIEQVFPEFTEARWRKILQEVHREPDFQQTIPDLAAVSQRASKLGVRIDQKKDNGQWYTDLNKNAPMTFIAKWDPLNPSRVSQLSLKQIASIG